MAAPSSPSPNPASAGKIKIVGALYGTSNGEVIGTERLRTLPVSLRQRADLLLSEVPAAAITGTRKAI